MKQTLLFVLIFMFSSKAFSQTPVPDTAGFKADTVEMKDWTIIYQPRTDSAGKKRYFKIGIRKSNKPPKRVSTNIFVLDLGFANWREETNYADANAGGYLRTTPNNPNTLTKDDMDLRNGKSSNVNLWLFMQRRDITKNRVFGIKYGLGLEMYNYRYESNISYNKNPAYIFKDSVSFDKNKLFASYLTVPVMVNIKPSMRSKFNIAFGVSGGYLIGSRNKQISDERGKEKTKGNIGLEKWRLAYIAEVGLGPVKLYGSYSMNPLHERGLKQYPFALGVRLFGN